MRIPDALAPLFDYGILEDVVRPLMSGKEAQVYVVVSGGQYRVAKVYKEAQNRTFKHRAEYTEGRKVRNSRDQRAMEKRSKHGRAQDEAAWRSTEVDMIHRLHAAGVRVPVPHHFVDGVLIMELILDADGNPAPRLADLVFEPDAAQAMYERLMREVVRMLAAGVVHGDFSDFNVLVGTDGPVIIDFPQSVDTAHNANARKLLVRDVDNMHRFLSQFAPNARRFPYAEEMWELFQQNALTPDTRLTGRYRPSERRANTHAVLELIQDANYDERKRRESLGMRGGPPVGSSGPSRPGQGRAPGPQGGGGGGGPRPPAHSNSSSYQGRQPQRPAAPDHARHSRHSGPTQPSQGHQPGTGRSERAPQQHGTQSSQGHSHGERAPHPPQQAPQQAHARHEPSRQHAPEQGRPSGAGQPRQNGWGRPDQPRDNGSARPDQPRHEPVRDGRPQNNAPRNGPPRNGPPPRRPQPQGSPHNGAQTPSASGGAPRDTSGGRAPRSGGHEGQRDPRDKARQIEVIVVRRPSLPR